MSTAGYFALKAQVILTIAWCLVFLTNVISQTSFPEAVCCRWMDWECSATICFCRAIYFLLILNAVIHGTVTRATNTWQESFCSSLKKKLKIKQSHVSYWCKEVFKSLLSNAILPLLSRTNLGNVKAILFQRIFIIFEGQSTHCSNHCLKKCSSRINVSFNTYCIKCWSRLNGPLVLA